MSFSSSLIFWTGFGRDALHFGQKSPPPVVHPFVGGFGREERGLLRAGRRIALNEPTHDAAFWGSCATDFRASIMASAIL